MVKHLLICQSATTATMPTTVRMSKERENIEDGKTETIKKREKNERLLLK